MPHAVLPLWAQVVWMSLSFLAILGGAISLALLVFRTIPMMREMRDIARESLHLAVHGTTRAGDHAAGADDLHRIAEALESRLPEGGPLRPRRSGASKKGIAHAPQAEPGPDVPGVPDAADAGVSDYPGSHQGTTSL